MKILNSLLFNEIGGPQIRVLTVVENLKSKELKIVILVPKENGNFYSYSKSKKIDILQTFFMKPEYFIDYRSVLHNIKWFFSIPITVRNIIKIIIENDIEVVQVNGLMNIQAALAAIISRRKIVWFLSSSLFPKIIVSTITPLILNFSNKIVVIAKRLIPYHFNKKIPSNLKIIYNSINFNLFDPPISYNSNLKNEIREELNLKSSDFIVGAVGSINPIKGYEFLIEAAKELKKKYNNIKIIIIGKILQTQIEYYNKLKDKILEYELSDVVYFIGEKSDIVKYYSIFDIFVLSSISEGGPRVTLEAMAMEKPVIATNVGAVDDQIIQNKSGIKIPIKNAKKIAEKIEFLLNNRDFAKKMGKFARKSAEQKFSFQNWIDQHEDLYLNW